MKREGWLILIAVAVLCAGGVAVWWLGAQPARDLAVDEIEGGVTLEENQAPDVREPTEKDAANAFEEKLEAYLGSVKQAYGKESRDYLDGEEHVELDIPVPPVDPVERKAPDLMPPPSDPAKRP